MMKVKIKPIIERDEFGAVSLPVARFRVIEETEAGFLNDRTVSVIDASTPEGRTIAKMQNHSITPTTFTSRDFCGGYNDDWFVDSYSHGARSVLRYGINIFCDKLQVNATGLVDPFCVLDSKGESIKVYRSGETPSARSGSTKKSDQYTVENAKSIFLSNIEAKLLNEAIDYLLVESDRRTVAVDIFARGRGDSNLGCIQIKDGFLETHTVLLYKNPTVPGAKLKIMVIDPNNFTYSSHLSNFNLDSMNKHKNSVEFVTIHQSIQIYTPVGVPGPLPNQYRNCVDIVVKMLFDLDQLNEKNRALAKEEVDLLVESRSDMIKIRECQAIQNVSNSIDIDDAVIASGLPVRIKQRSDLKEAQIFNDLERVINSKYDIIVKLTDRSGKNTEMAIYKSILANNQSDDNKLLRLLFEHNESCNERIKTECDKLQQHSIQYDVALLAEAKDGGYIE